MRRLLPQSEFFHSKFVEEFTSIAVPFGATTANKGLQKTKLAMMDSFTDSNLCNSVHKVPRIKAYAPAWVNTIFHKSFVFSDLMKNKTLALSDEGRQVPRSLSETSWGLFTRRLTDKLLASASKSLGVHRMTRDGKNLPLVDVYLQKDMPNISIIFKVTHIGHISVTVEKRHKPKFSVIHSITAGRIACILIAERAIQLENARIKRTASYVVITAAVAAINQHLGTGPRASIQGRSKNPAPKEMRAPSKPVNLKFSYAKAANKIFSSNSLFYERSNIWNSLIFNSRTHSIDSVNVHPIF